MRRRDLFRTDLSAFMCVIFILAGCLLVLLMGNLATLVADPANVVVSTVLRTPGLQPGASGNQRLPGRLLADGNRDKVPHYVEVHRSFLVLPPGRRLPVASLAQPGNAFERFLERVGTNPAASYVVLQVRPRSATLTRQLRQTIIARGIDVGLELYEDHQPARPWPSRERME